MNTSPYKNPEWIRDAVATRARGRRPLGAWKAEHDNFISLFNVRAENFGSTCTDPIEVPGSEAVVEIVKKEYVNNSEQEEEDDVEIKGQKSSSEGTTRNYQLTIGTERTKQLQVGGSLGLSASFFNLGGPGVGLNAGVNASYTTTKKDFEQTQFSQEKSTTLGKEYSITGKIKIPARTKLEVTITTYSMNFRIPGIKVIVSAPASANLKVLLVRTCPCQSKFCYVTAEDYLKHLVGPNAVRRVGTRVEATQTSQLTYLGEKTKVSKIATKFA